MQMPGLMEQEEATQEPRLWSRKDEENQPGDVGWRYRQLHRVNDGLEWAGDRVGDGASYVGELFGGLF
jgi:hypothetical protein